MHAYDNSKKRVMCNLCASVFAPDSDAYSLFVDDAFPTSDGLLARGRRWLCGRCVGVVADHLDSPPAAKSLQWEEELQ